MSSGLRPPGRRRHDHRQWCALAGTATLAAGAAGAAGGLVLTGTLPLKERPIPATTRQGVQSTAGWQPVTGVTVKRGDRITVHFVSGEWTSN
ncbi:hypothetical protein ACFXKY_19590 [Streptomyces canus]|uniref:hypothetical protein n=1 Tax=Streptomyces canus TaxID=58343 RepID=UPI003681BCBB